MLIHVTIALILTDIKMFTVYLVVLEGGRLLIECWRDIEGS